MLFCILNLSEFQNHQDKLIIFCHLIRYFFQFATYALSITYYALSILPYALSVTYYTLSILQFAGIYFMRETLVIIPQPARFV
jgi:hypothetical protein